MTMMRAAVYRGTPRLEVEEIERPEPGASEILVRVEVCGVCGTDVKKIDKGLVKPPRVFGHEIAGVVAGLGSGVRRFKEGDRVVVHHHIPCLRCFYCERKLYAQCPIYKENGTTAGFEPSGGGFAEYLKAAPHIVEQGAIPIPAGVKSEVACLVEPVNTCLKAVDQARVQAGETVLVVGQGPIGSMLMQLARVRGARVLASDLSTVRLDLARTLGAETFDASVGPVDEWVRERTSGRGADVVLLAATGQAAFDAAVEATRPGGRIVPFSATSRGETYQVDLGLLAAAEKQIVSVYSASVDVQAEAADLVFTEGVKLEPLLTDFFPLARINEAIDLFRRPAVTTLKIAIDMRRG
ncbi:MAG: alcohol dehydrogenase catalytic domain-containing protein [Vicinamibacteria bacterium]|nr:alcohol dehydrogenase catalytic domain-containing protein [Vicinamibacteria bacterium]